MGERRIWQTVVVRKPGKHLFKTRINVGSDRIRGEERNRERERISPAEITTSLFLPRRRSQEGYTSRRDFLMRLTDLTTSTLRLDLHFIHFLSGLTFLPPFPSYPNRTTSLSSTLRLNLRERWRHHGVFYR